MSREAFSVEYTPARGPRRRVRFIPRADMDGYWRETAEWNGCTWRTTGREPVDDVVAFDTAEVLK